MNAKLIALLVATTACSADVSGPGVNLRGTLRETANATIVPSGAETGGRAVLTTIDLENISGSSVPVSWGADCSGAGALQLRVYRNSGGSQTLVWNSAALPRVLGCPTQLIKRTIDSGGHVQLQYAVLVSSILGDSLPADTYTLTATALITPELDAEVPAGTVALSSGVAAPPGTDLDGTWAGSANGLSLSLALRWTADSVTGTGTYSAASTNTFGCGGGTLRGTGTVTYKASRTQDQFRGGMQFSGGWSPPFFGVVVDEHTISSGFMSVDLGPCYLALTRQ